MMLSLLEVENRFQKTNFNIRAKFNPIDTVRGSLKSSHFTRYSMITVNNIDAVVIFIDSLFNSKLTKLVLPAAPDLIKKKVLKISQEEFHVAS